jgi:putative NADH-flavin reductase
LIEFFKTTTRFIIFCETRIDCEWDFERKYEKDEYEKDEYEKNKYEKDEYKKNEYKKNVVDVDVVDVDVVDVDAVDVDDVDDVDVDIDSIIIENEEKKKRAREQTRVLIDRKKDWKVRILLIHWSEYVC